MSVISEARSRAKRALCDPAYEASLRSAQQDLQDEIDGGGMDLTSATVNGQTFSGTVSATKQRRLMVLDAAIAMIDAGAIISSRSVVRGIET